jgi:DnaJ-class molecular chaperone
MNPFDIFDIGIKLNPDLKDLRKKYIELQQSSHVDHGGDEQDSEEINTAYEILKNRDKRISYVINNLLKINLKDFPLSPNFLMEMMELNDLISDTGSKEEAKKSLSELGTNLNLEFIEIDKSVKRSGIELNENRLAIIDWYQRFKYFDRLRKNFEGIEEL